jgi:hypothetical protein
MRHGEVRKHPQKSEWAYPVDETLEGADTENLSASERQTLADAKAGAVDLPEDWNDQGENED